MIPHTYDVIQARRRWADDLLSGEFEQAQFTLVAFPEYNHEPSRYCCLGVLCDRLDPENRQGWVGDDMPSEEFTAAVGLYDDIGIDSLVVYDKVGLPTVEYSARLDSASDYSIMNDKKEYTFDMIARVVLERVI